MNKTSAKRSRPRTPNNRTTTGYRISDELWAVLQPLLAVHVNTHRFGGGRPRVADRRCADAIFYVLRTGCHEEQRSTFSIFSAGSMVNSLPMWSGSTPSWITWTCTIVMTYCSFYT